MQARGCVCPAPQVFADSPAACSKCGRPLAPEGISASTWELALAIAEVALGRRKTGDTHGQTGGCTKRAA